jgi:hypothetical protein
VTSDAPGRLYLLTGNHVVDDRRTLPSVAPAVAPADEEISPAGTRLPVLIGVGAGLTIVLALLGGQQWPLPGRDGGVSDVPQSLLSFLLLATGACVWTAGRLSRPAGTLRSPAAVHLWWGLVLGAAAVSLAAALSLASAAGAGQPPQHLAAHSLVPLVPAVLAGVLASDAGRAARIRAALGTGLVTVPLAALGWALLASPAGSSAGLPDALAGTGLSAVAPLALAVAFVAADRRGRAAR